MFFFLECGDRVEYSVVIRIKDLVFFLKLNCLVYFCFYFLGFLIGINCIFYSWIKRFLELFRLEISS